VKNLIAFAVLGIFAILLVGCGTKTTTLPSNEAPPPRISLNQTPKLTHGPEAAKVHIEAFFPLNEKHLKIVEFLNSLADKYPGKVKVAAWDFRTEEGGKETEKAFGKICGGMRINGKSDFKVMMNGKLREISIMDGEWVTWTKPEVEASLAQVVKETYPASDGRPASE